MIDFTFIPEFDVFESPVTIDGSLFFLELRYDKRGDRWRMWFYDQDKDLIIGGIKLVTKVPLFEAYSDPRLPTGQIKMTRADNPDLPITKDDLGKNAFLSYLTSREIETLELTSRIASAPVPRAGVTA